MALPVKEKKDKVKVLFITDDQYGVMVEFFEYMEFENETSINITDFGRNTHIEMCGLDITIMGLDAKIESIKNKFNYIFVENEFLQSGERYKHMDKINDILFPLIEYADITEKFIGVSCGIYFIKSSETAIVSLDLLSEFNFDEDEDDDGFWKLDKYEWYYDSCENYIPDKYEFGEMCEQIQYDAMVEDFVKEFGQDKWEEVSHIEERVFYGEISREDANKIFAKLNKEN